ncbi:heme lyase CcmF/NrfE family subunit [Oceanicella actignis]|uniref:Cytochrome c-type biogenesis protein CcmF n=1 Tax=Oceanicella actignis TaxID=1189325 RepID=A0A1M7S2V7_9RHOB|nr:heme lyase CcmF/NrfE family subunit [Oceanicella actignis]SES90255.1 cytochrome c-type biogenesis protein CcmF [Oceanicella actignis]SHN52695.1 cytochrome c-type biogenesis protein CcmF [Oceanicella actignis]
MIVEIGHFALILAFMVSIVQATAPMIGASRGWADWMRVAEPAAALCWALTATSFAALTWAFVNSDFSVKLAAEHSNTLQPLLYRVTGVWGNHEGSLLLWTLILTLYGAMVAAFGGALPPTLKARTLAVQGLIGAAFFAFMLFTSNPFERLPNPPLDGADLNPLLQDPGLAFHPPFLYLGYVGLSMSYSFAVAALIEGRVDAAWARWVRPWTLAAWTALTVGIALGSYWAYYELGWGGWWFWDPVENASFMPWLAATALLHSAIVVEKRDTLKSWTILLAILAFTLSLMGTFIVRSGLLTSVHAFASDPTRGVFVLAMLAAASGGALALYAWRAPQMRAGGVFAPVSRESALVLNNLLLAAAAGVVLLGTLMPMIREYWDGAKISVGAPFFELAFTPFMVALAIILPIGAALPWKRGRLGRTARRMAPALALALAAAALVWALQTGRSALGPVGVGLGTWLIAGALAEQLERARLGRAPAAETLRRLRKLPRADWGKALAHAGLGLSFIGVSAVTAWEAELIRTARPGDSLELSGYVFVFDDVRQVPGPNYVARQGVFRVFEGGVETARLTPEKRVYTVQRMPTTEAAIDMGLARDLYVVLGDPQDDGSWAVRIYVKPLVNWIWIGALVMALAGLVSLSDRRYRVGAAARRPAPAAVAGAAR